MSTYNIEMNLLNSSSSYDTLYPKVNLSNSQGTLPASQITSGTFSSGDYTIQGNLTLKGSGNYGTKLNLGDGDYVHISEPTDDCLEIKGKKINFVTTDTSSSGLTWNNSAIGGNSDSVLKAEYGTRTGNGTTSFSITLNKSYSRVISFIYKDTSTFSGNGYSNLIPLKDTDQTYPVSSMPMVDNIGKSTNYTMKFFMNLSAVSNSNSFDTFSVRNLFPKDSYPVFITNSDNNSLTSSSPQFRFYNRSIYAQNALQANQNSSTYEYYVIGY